MKVAQSCPSFCYPVDYTVHGVLQARILEWGAFPFTRGSSQPRDWTQVSILQVDSLPAEPPGKPKNTGWVAYPFSSGSFRPRNRTGVSCIAGGFFYQLSYQGLLTIILPTPSPVFDCIINKTSINVLTCIFWCSQVCISQEWNFWVLRYIFNICIFHLAVSQISCQSLLIMYENPHPYHCLYLLLPALVFFPLPPLTTLGYLLYHIIDLICISQ